MQANEVIDQIPKPKLAKEAKNKTTFNNCSNCECKVCGGLWM